MNKTEMTVSVIVPIYGVEQYLKQCIESILNQTLKDIEIILVDDGSKDNCPKICDEYAAKDERIVVIHKENGGLVSARQAGVERATGYYVGFVDGDDWIEPTMFEKMVEVADSNTSDLVTCGFFYSYPEKELMYKSRIREGNYNGYKLTKLMETIIYAGKFYEWGLPPAVWNKLYIREKYFPFQNRVDRNISLGEDLAVTSGYYSICENITVIDKPYYHYRQIPSSMVHSYDPKLQSKITALFKFLDTYACDECIKKQIGYYKVFMLANLLKNIRKRGGNIEKLVKEYQGVFEDTNFESVLKLAEQVELPLRYRAFFKLGIGKKYKFLGFAAKIAFPK